MGPPDVNWTRTHVGQNLHELSFDGLLVVLTLDQHQELPTQGHERGDGIHVEFPVGSDNGGLMLSPELTQWGAKVA